MRSIKHLLLIALLGVLLPACFLKKNKKTQKKPLSTTSLNSAPGFMIPPDSVKKGSPKRFRELITASYKADSGFLNAYTHDDKYYLEIPDSILGRDILLVSRVAKAAAAVTTRPNGGSGGYGGSQIGERVIRLAKGSRHKIYAHLMSYRERSADTSTNGIYRSLERSTLHPIAAVFDIKATGASSSVIDVSEFMMADQSLVNFDATSKRAYGIGLLQKDKSYILSIDAFSSNIELQTVNTYAKGEGTVTYQLNNSWLLLPQTPMRGRLADRRVGYFEEKYLDFDEPQGVGNLGLITRFRLEPKPEDVQRYLAGELVEPAQPIIFYIDPTTPKKWVKSLIAGVNDWQKAFEKAGFKNAVYALEAPSNKREWSLFDAKHNAIVYMPANVANAMGPHIHDPRSGEILETHVNWFHNVMTLLHDWYMVQAGPNDPRARKMVFDDELMGQLIRFVSSHEVGHTLGLRHNFLASSSVPVDSLRSKSYLEKNGFCPSIMDYARFNFVAQPKDNIPPDLLMPRIGVYDEWAIEWGYRWYPDTETIAQEALRLDKITTAKLSKDKRLRFQGDYWGSPSDPRAQTEDLGDDVVKMGTYGIENLKIVLRNLPEWTHTPGGNYENLSRMNKQVVGQFHRYMLHALCNVTLYPTDSRSETEKGAVFGYVPKAKRKAALAFIDKQLFDTPTWLFNPKTQTTLGTGNLSEAGRIQEKVLSQLLGPLGYIQLETANGLAPAREHYSYDELVTDLRSGIWKELKSGKAISFERRRLQRLFAEHLINLQNIGLKDPLYRRDAVPIAREHIRSLISEIERASKTVRDRDSRMHLNELASRFRWSLKPESYIPVPAAPVSPLAIPGIPSSDSWNEYPAKETGMQYLMPCFE